MFITLLLANLVISFIVCLFVAQLFKGSISRIMERIIDDDIHSSWSRYIIFAIYVVGISGGVRVWEMEKYITAEAKNGAGQVIQLTGERWVLEVYRTIIGTLKSDATMLLVFFIFALIAYVIVKGLSIVRTHRTGGAA